MVELKKDQNDLQSGNDTYIQILNIWLSAIERQAFDSQKYLQYSKRMFRFCFVRRVIKLYKHQNTSGKIYKNKWAI